MTPLLPVATLTLMSDPSPNPAPDRAPVKRWARIRLWAGYLYILLAVIFAQPSLYLAIAGAALAIIGIAIRLVAGAT